MIRCTLELVPGGVGEPEQLGIIEIGNGVMRTVQSDGRRGDYFYEVEKKRKGRVVAKGVIRDFPRLSYHPWNLVRRILDEAADNNGGIL